MRRGAAALIAVAVLASAACAPVAPVPAPPGAKRVVSPPDPIHVDTAVSDTLREMKRVGLTRGEVSLWSVPASTRYEDILAYYDARLTGWRRETRMPDRTKAARSAAWRAGAHALAISLISPQDNADRRPAANQILALVSDAPAPSP